MSGKPTLVLGIGNLLMGDEGVGVHAVRRLEETGLPDGVHLLDGGTGGFHLLSCLQEHDPVVMIDACLDAAPIGEVRVLEPRYASDFPRVLSAHDIGLRDLIESASLLQGLPRMVLITVSIDPHQEMGTELSAPVAASLDQIVPLVAEVLERLAAERVAV